MLIRFTVENFRSIRDRVTLDMEASNIVSENKEVDVKNLISGAQNMKLLKLATIYGANASGKSNLVKALKFMKSFVRDSSRESLAQDPINAEPFRLDKLFEAKPSVFEIEFLSKNQKYRYGFEVTNFEVISEWLYHTPSSRERLLFERASDKFFLSTAFKKEGQGLIEKTRKNALFISVAAQFNGRISNEVISWFSSFGVISGLVDSQYSGYTASVLAKEKMREPILKLIKLLDVGIENIRTEKRRVNVESIINDLPFDVRERILSDGLEVHDVKTEHTVFSKGKAIGKVEFDLQNDESAGTQKLFSWAGPIVDSLLHRNFIVIDEMDARFHPLITQTLIEIFQSSESNPRNVQLIFASHDTNLLRKERFRRDQIWFTEKDRFGGTDFYSLADYQVRNDASFQKEYLLGKYGAIPFIGALDFLTGWFDETSKVSS